MTGQREALDRHAQAQAAQVELLRAELPRMASGYRPAAWCASCHAPHPVDAVACPECQYPTARPLLREVPTDWALHMLAALGLGCITAWRQGCVVEQRFFALPPTPFDWRWD